MAAVSLLLDTHALLWWLIDSPKLSTPARNAIADQDNKVLVSSASAWEIATKYRLGKLPEAEALMDNFEHTLRRERFESLNITMTHARTSGMLPGIHRDPFDRMLIAQAQLENLILVSNEALFEQFGVRRVW